MGADDLRPMDCRVVYGNIPRDVLREALIRCKKKFVKHNKIRIKLTETCLKLLALIYFRARQESNSLWGVTDPLSISYLSDALGVDTETITSSLQRLVDFNFVTCDKPEDNHATAERSVVAKIKNYGLMFVKETKVYASGFVRLPWEWLHSVLECENPTEVRLFYLFALYSYTPNCNQSNPSFSISSVDLRNYLCASIRPGIIEKCLSKFKEVLHFSSSRKKGNATVFECRLDNAFSCAHIESMNRLQIYACIDKFKDSLETFRLCNGNIDFNNPWHCELAGLTLPEIGGWPSFKKAAFRKEGEEPDRSDLWTMFDNDCCKEYAEKCEKYGVTVVFKAICKYLRNGAIYKHFSKTGMSSKTRSEYLKLLNDYIRRQANPQMA